MATLSYERAEAETSIIEYFSDVAIEGSGLYGEFRYDVVRSLDDAQVLVSHPPETPGLPLYLIKIHHRWIESAHPLQRMLNLHLRLDAPILLGARKAAADATRTLHEVVLWYPTAAGDDRRSAYLAVANIKGVRHIQASNGSRHPYECELYGLGPTPAAAEDAMHADIANDMIERL